MRVAVTGAAGDLGTAVLRELARVDAVTEVVAIDLREPRLADPKLRTEIADVRSDRLAALLEGCEAVLHLAYVLIPRHGESDAHSVNFDGSRNVLEAVAATGARRLVVASSISAHGGPEAGLAPVDETDFPAGATSRFYFREKAQLEHLLDWWEHEHPDSGLVITRMRPGFIWGPDFDNPALELMGAPLAVVPDDGGRTQLVHQDEVAGAFVRATLGDAPGPFLLTTDDAVSIEEMAAVTGGRAVRIPTRLAEWALRVGRALRVSPIGPEWAVSGDRVGRPRRARDELGWEPLLTSRESAIALLFQRGRRVRYVDGRPRREVLERALEVPTAMLREAAESNPGLGGFDVGAALEGAEHDFVDFRDLRVHVEVHEAGPGAPTVVAHHGLGDHARRLTPLAVRLAEEGFNAILVDRPGHGLSEGRRGHCPLPWALDVYEASIAYARARFAGPVILLGDSLGGITSWYLLTREPDVDAAICHSIAHPGVDVDPSMRWKRPLLEGLARAAPYTPIPVRRVADYDHVALDPGTKAYFDREVDRIFNFSVSAASVASYLHFEPDRPWQALSVPVLVLSGAEDRMVSAAHDERCLAAARPPRSTHLKVEGAGHQLFLDHLADALPPVIEWTRRALAAAPTRERSPADE